MYAQPTVILISSRADESLDEHLNPEGKARGSTNGDGRSMTTVEALLLIFFYRGLIPPTIYT